MSGSRVLMLAAAVLGVVSVAVVGWRAVEQPPTAIRRAPAPPAVAVTPPAVESPAAAQPVIAAAPEPAEAPSPDKEPPASAAAVA